MYRVSIIAPVYNSAEYIEESIQTVLNQTYPNIEYIIMDAGSTDGTLEITQRYADRLTIISEPDNGQSDAINKGWKRATGDILAWLNGDDLYYPDTVEKAVTFLQEHPETMWVYGNAQFLYEDGTPGNFHYPILPWDYEKLLTFGCYISQPSVFLRKEVIERFGYLDESLHFGMDYEYWLRIGKVFPPVHVPAVRAKVKIFRDTKSRSGSYKRINELEQMLKKYGATTLPQVLRHQWVEAMLDKGDLINLWRFPRSVPRGTAKWILKKTMPEQFEQTLRRWFVRR